MGYAHGTRWTDEAIKQGVLRVVKSLDLDYMPSRNQIRRFYGDDRLTNKISKTIGYYGWASKLGLKIQDSDTTTGKLCEAKIAELLRNKGYKVEKMSQNHPYDLLVNDCVKVDVKYSKPYKPGVGNDFYSFAFRKRNASCDIYILVAVDESGATKNYVVPAYKLKQTQISLGVNSNKFIEFIDKYGLIDKCADAFLEMGRT